MLNSIKVGLARFHLHGMIDVDHDIYSNAMTILQHKGISTKPVSRKVRNSTVNEDIIECDEQTIKQITTMFVACGIELEYIGEKEPHNVTINGILPFVHPDSFYDGYRLDKSGILIEWLKRASQEIQNDR